MEALSEKDLRDMFDRRFERLGGGLPFRAEWQIGIDSLARAMASALGIDPKAIYCDVVNHDAVNAFVTKNDGMYFIGITNGVVSGVFHAIGEALEMLKPALGLSDSTITEIHLLLNMYALQFVIGHELGHIAFGHIDRELAVTEMAGEADMSSTYLEEAYADMIGAMAVIAVKKSLYRIRDLTNPGIAVGLLQLPIACVISFFKKVTAAKIVTWPNSSFWVFMRRRLNKTRGYPHPAVRLMMIGRMVIEWMSLFVSDEPDPDDQRKAEGMLSAILQAVSPSIQSYMMSDVQVLRAEIGRLMKVIRPEYDRWQQKGLWLVVDTPRFDEMFR
jgi:hypothetical protein